MADKGANKSSGPSAIVIAYLILYNFIQCLGWTAILFTICLHYIVEGTHKGAYHTIASLLMVFQTAAILEVVHALFGMVRSNWVLTAFQVASRVFLVWGIAIPIKAVQNDYGMIMLLFAWSVTEMIRYSYYACGLVNQTPYSLTWCRYTFFIILYPIGVTGELLSIYNAMSTAKRTGMYSISMPNKLNMSFSYYHFLFIVMASYLPIFPQLYLHMFAQRKKIIGGAHKKTE